MSMAGCSKSGSPDAKKPCKGILKSSSSFDTQQAAAGNRKSAKFDEINVLQTYHPSDKDYGHMKIEEPKTPYNYTDPALADEDALDASILTEKLNEAAAISRLSFSEGDSDDDDDGVDELETDEEKAKRLEFEKRRKAHYKEFEAVKLARKLIEEEEDDEDDGEQCTDDKIPSTNIVDPIDETQSTKMEVDKMVTNTHL